MIWVAGFHSEEQSVIIEPSGKSSEYSSYLAETSAQRKLAEVMHPRLEKNLPCATLDPPHRPSACLSACSDRVYLFPLPEVGKLVSQPRRDEDEGSDRDMEGTSASVCNRGDGTNPGASLPIIAIPGTSHPDFAVPISFMSLQEDHMVMTFATAWDGRPGTGLIAPMRVTEEEFDEETGTLVTSGPNYLAEEEEEEDADPMVLWRTGRPLPERLPLAKTVRFVYFAPWVVEKLKAG